MNNALRFGTIGVMGLAAALAAAQDIQVTVNGAPVSFRGEQPIMSGDRVLVPLRGVLEQMGAKVEWNPDSQTVRARSGGADVRLTIGQRTASVNGNPVTLDVPAQIINGSTMVPLRFVGEAMGNTVDWNSQTDMVVITTSSDTYAMNPDSRPERFTGGEQVVPSGTVIPVTLDERLSSASNHKGDRFTASVDSNELPTGSRIEGFIAGCRPQRGNEPGMMELRFDRLDMPDGSAYRIRGSLIGLDDKSVTRHGDHLVARNTSVNRSAYTGIGAGAGFVLGLIGHRPVEDTALGALLGNGIGAVQGRQVHNVILDQGTRFGVRFDADASYRHR